MGLGRIFVFSALSGFSFAISYGVGQELQAGLTFSLLDVLNRSGNPNIQAFVMVVSIAVTILSIYSLSVFFRQIYENRLAGIITAVVGFAGSMIIMSGSVQNISLIIFGIALWIAGIIVASLIRKKA